MKLKIFLKPTIFYLFLLKILIINFKYNYAVFTSKSQDPLAVTELQQHFIAPHRMHTYRNGSTTLLEDVPYKRLIFAALLPSHELDNKNDCILPKVLSVLELAIHHVQRLGFAHNARIDITLISRDTNCSSVHGPLGFFEIYMQQPEINAVWGLPCEYVLAPISRYAGVWQIPVFTSAGNAADFQNKATSYPTLTRLKGAQANNLGNAVRAIIDSFNWTRTALIYQNEHTKIKGNSVCFFCMFVVHDKLDEYKASSYQQAFDTNQWKKADIERMLRNLSKQTRIVIMCADPQSIRQIMLTAEELNMIDSGEYVFINIELFSRVPHLTSQPWFDKNDTKENNLRARKAYTAMLTVTPKQPTDDEYTRISNEIKEIAATKYNYTFQDDEPISAFVTSFFDGVLLYANALNDSIREDPSVLTRPINGTDMVRRMWNRSFMGITGNVTIDANGDRISAYSLLDMNPTTGRFEIVAHFQHNKLEYVPGKEIHWAGDRVDPPLDRPVCGYDGSLCPDNSLPGYAILSIVLGAVVVIMSICFFFGYRHYKSEAEINSMAWRISIDEVIFHNSAGRCFRGSLHSLVKHSSQMTLMSDDMGSLSGDRQIFIPVGLFRGCKAAVKIIDERNINLTRSLMLELKRMKDLQHEHLVKFYGACLDPPKSFILTEYCPKGSLQDILENEQFQLDWMFKLSLMHDIVRGMHFLHNSDIKSHGNLKSSNCVVDSRFVLKICDFGLHTLRKTTEDKGSDIENCNSYAYWSKLLWTAPELLRMENNRPPEGTQKGDVYSFGIIVHEITTRQGPFYLGKLEEEKPPQEIIYLVKGYPHVVQYPFRPQLVDIPNNYKEINTVMQKCWSEDPTERPDFNALKTIIRNINKDNETGNIVDNLLKRMEQYANNLEELVEERTQDYIEEKKKCEKLLYQLLPQSVAAQLISGQPVVAETFDQVTIYFSDIVGFTAISAESTPMQVVQFLNDLYTCFDSIVENFDVYKVETIGDAYMVVSGLPIRNGNQHAREIARLALALLEAVHNFKIHHRPNDRLKLRIGLHTGACVAGVVGLKMPRYCLFGDTVNTASRMESNGEALKIHISEKTKLALDEFGTFITTKRGYVPMKGKGEMLTFWLEGEVQKVESPISPQKLMLSRRSSLKQVPRYGMLSKQNSDAQQFLPPYQLQSPQQQQQQQLQEQQQLQDSRQNSPNLRVKRKISSSSPKLNGNDYKTDDLFNYLEANAKGGAMNSIKLPANDIYSSRSLRDDLKDGCWEMANFRLPLSGTLKSHNSTKHSYTQLASTQSNSNLAGLLQPAASRLKLKNSPTITSLMNTSETASLNSANRIKFNISENPEETQNLVNNQVYEDEECEAEETEEEMDCGGSNNKANTALNGEAYLMNHKLYGTPAQMPAHLSNCNSSSPPSQYQNLVKANNCRNFQLLQNPSTNLEQEKQVGNAKAGLEDNDLERGAATSTGNHQHHNHHHTSAVNAVTQPLLTKINS